MSVMWTSNGIRYTNPPTGSEYISANGMFMKQTNNEWYYWCTYHKSWVFLESKGVKCYKLEVV